MSEQNCRYAQENGWIEVARTDELPTKPLISVIMPAYNHALYLADAIEGVLHQKTEFPIELLIGEDCSSDDTRKIALRYQRENPRVIRLLSSDKNVGMQENIRHLSQSSRGEFIAICEGDDYWHHPRKLAMQVDRFRSNPRCTIVHSDYDHLIKSLGSLRIRRSVKMQSGTRELTGSVYGELQRGQVFIMTCTVVLRKSAVLEFFGSRLDYRNFKVLDWPLFAFASRFGEVEFIPVSTAVYRRVSGSAMNSGAEAAVERARNALKIYGEFETLFGEIGTGRWSKAGMVGRPLYESAIWARDPRALGEAMRLLEAAGCPRPGGFKNSIDKLSIRSRLVFRARSLLKDVRRGLSEFRDYQRYAAKS